MKPRWRILADRLTARLADAHYVNAQAIRDTLIRRDRVPPERIVVVVNGVDCERFAP